MGKVKQMLMDLMDEAIAHIGDYENFNDWASAYPRLHEEELKEYWDEFWTDYIFENPRTN